MIHYDQIKKDKRSVQVYKFDFVDLFIYIKTLRNG